MPVGNREALTFVNIKEGKFIIKEGDVKKEYNYIEGWITGLEIKDDEYQGKAFKKLMITLEDGIERFQLQMRLDSGYGRAFCCLIPNVDPLKDVNISLSYKVENKKPQAGLFIRQGTTPIKWAFTRDNPNGLPELKSTVHKGETLWDNTDQERFFIDLLLNKIKPTLPKHPPTHGIVMHTADKAQGQAAASFQAQAPSTQPAEVGKTFLSPDDITEPMDDLPF